MEKLAYDWAVWDDTYKYMENQNQEYLDSNMSYDTFENLSLDIIVLINNDNELVYGKELDSDAQEMYDVDKDLIDLLSNDKEIKSIITLVVSWIIIMYLYL